MGSKRLLLIGQPAEPLAIPDDGLVRLGASAWPDMPPTARRPAEFPPYPGVEDIRRACEDSVREADALLAHLSDAIPRETGLGKDLPPRFWEIFLFYYLVFICGQVEDMRARCGPIATNELTYGAPTNQAAPPPQDLYELLWSLLARSGIRTKFMDACVRAFIPGLEERPLTYREQPPAKPLKESLLHGLLSTAKKRAIGTMLQARSGPRITDTLLLDFYRITLADLMGLARAGLPLLHPDLRSMTAAPTPIDAGLRERIFGGLPEPYHAVLRLTFPASCLEGLEQTLAHARQLSQTPALAHVRRLITFGQIWSSPRQVRATAGLLAANGVEIVSLQHGGGFGGTFAFCPPASIEFRLADRFVTWGWSSEEEPLAKKVALHPLPSIYLSRLPTKPRRRKRWDILLLVHTDSQYLHWLFPPVFADMADDYFKREQILFDGLKRESSVAVKLYVSDYGWHQDQWIADRFPSFQRIKHGSFTALAPRAALSIVDHNATGFLDLLAMRSPFMATWNRKWFLGSPTFEKHLDALRQSGIFHDSPQSLLDAYRDVSTRLDEWWAEPKRQAALESMARTFAWTSSTSILDFKNFLMNNPPKAAHQAPNNHPAHPPFKTNFAR